MAKLDRRIILNEKSITSTQKTQLLNTHITLTEAVARVNEKVPEGYHVSRDLFAHRVARGSIPCVKLGKNYYFKPEVIDELTFKPKKHFQQGSITPVRVTSAEELQPLIERYGPLVDIAGFLEAMQAYTHRPYKVGAIKQRLLRGTIVYVAYFGSEKRKHYLFPVNQIYDPDFFKVTKYKGEPQIPEVDPQEYIERETKHYQTVLDMS